MKIVPPITFEEELNMLKSNFLLILDKYEACKKTCRLRGCPKCKIFSKQLDDIINVQCDELKKNVATATLNLDTVIADMNHNMKTQKGLKNSYTGNLMRLDRGSLAAEPRRVDAYEQKIYHLCNLFVYILGTVAIVYYFQKQLKLAAPKGKAVPGTLSQKAMAKARARNRGRGRVGGKPPGGGPPGGKPPGAKGIPKPKAPPKPGAVGKGKAAPGKGKAAAGKGKAAAGKGKAAAGKGKAAAGKGKAAAGKGKAAAGKGKAAPGKGKAAAGKGKAAAGKGKAAAGKGKAAAGKGKAAAGKPAGKGAPNLRRQAMAKAAARAAARRAAR